jgi:hypothetical protein
VTQVAATLDFSIRLRHVTHVTLVNEARFRRPLIREIFSSIASRMNRDTVGFSFNEPPRA